MKQYTSAAAVISIGLIIAANASAYGSYCENVTAAEAASGYSEQLKSLSEQFETALSAPENTTDTDEEAETDEPSAGELYSRRIEIYREFSSAHSELEYSLAEKLIDYDLLLKKLELETERYSKLKSSSDSLAQKYLIGECTKQEADEAEKQRSDKYYEIESLLFDISALKNDIEGMTGESLKSDSDFSSAYLITDALKLSLEELAAWGTVGTICVANGAETVSEAADITAEYTSAVKNYYALGESLRAYIDAAEAYSNAEDEFRLGNMPSSQLDALNTAFEDAKIDALSSKAEYAKSLLELDKTSGGALTCSNGTSEGLAYALSNSLPEELRGSGLWLTRRNGDMVSFSVQMFPFELNSDKDTAEFDVIYNGKLLCTSSGQTAVFKAPQPSDGVTRAEVVFRKNGTAAESYLVDIYSPFGEFLED